MLTFYEFFAGGGMARAGLGPDWKCLFANDIDKKKAAAYTANWGSGEFKCEDVYELKHSDFPGVVDLAWASFPCQDLSLAGSGAGLNGERSGTFWGFWQALNNLKKQRRSPKMLVLENVCGALTSHGGKDFVEICRALGTLNYAFGAVVIDAALFLPQSRPRLFIIAVHRSHAVPISLKDIGPSNPWHPKALQKTTQILPRHIRKDWIWWRLEHSERRASTLAELIEEQPTDVVWHLESETKRLLGQMSVANRAKVHAAKQTGLRTIGTVYKRTRRDEEGNKIQRAEVRFDGTAGCLRTPAGGSSRQIVLIVQGSRVRSRLMSPREAANLMGLNKEYFLPSNYNEAYHLAGDGVAVPVVRFLAEQILEPSLLAQPLATAAE